MLAWYARHARDLPWRRTSASCRVWLSGIMRQQTRVEAVIPYYERFPCALPTVTGLAAAAFGRVLDRLLCVTESIDAAATERALWVAAEALVSAGRPGDFNSAIPRPRRRSTLSTDCLL